MGLKVQPDSLWGRSSSIIPEASIDVVVGWKASSMWPQPRAVFGEYSVHFGKAPGASRESH